MIGKVFKLAHKFHDPMDDEFIVIEELNHVVALMNNRTNSVKWVTRHVLNLDFEVRSNT